MSPDQTQPQGFGLLGFTWRNGRVPDERAFPAMKAAIERGATIWSSSSVYGQPPDPPTAGLQLLRRYFEKYPEDASKVTLFIRGCFDAVKFVPTCDRAAVRASWVEANEILEGFKKIDVFGPARMDQDVPVEETLTALKELKDEGKIGAIGLSEVRAETIRRASAIVPVVYAEVEFSLWSTEMLENGVAQAAKDCGVTLLAYAPLGYGFLTGSLKKLDDIPQDDGRRMLGRFQADTFDKNLEIVHKIQAIAGRSNATPAQLAIAWIRSRSNQGVCGALIPIPGATAAERVIENSTLVGLTPEDKEELDVLARSMTVAGVRQIKGDTRNIWT